MEVIAEIYFDVVLILRHGAVYNMYCIVSWSIH